MCPAAVHKASLVWKVDIMSVCNDHHIIILIIKVTKAAVFFTMDNLRLYIMRVLLWCKFFNIFFFPSLYPIICYVVRIFSFRFYDLSCYVFHLSSPPRRSPSNMTTQAYRHSQTDNDHGYVMMMLIKMICIIFCNHHWFHIGIMFRFCHNLP